LGVTLGVYYRLLYTLAFQFDLKVARALLPSPEAVEVTLSPKGRIRHVYVRGVRVLTMRPGDGLFTLSLEGGEVVRSSSKPPRFRVVVRGREAALIRGSVLRPIVVDVDPEARAGDEVIIVDEDDRLVGVGRLKLPPVIVKSLERGEVVRVRSLRKVG